MTYATILVNLQAGHSNRQVLDAARSVADRFGAVIIGSAACMPMRILYAEGAYGEGMYFGDMFEQDNTAMAAQIAQAEAEFRDALGGGSRVLAWRSAIVMTALADDLAAAASRADLVLAGAMPDGDPDRARQADMGDLVMEAGRPVLLIPPAPAALAMDRVMVAWKNTTETRRAITAAIPLLKRARQVTLVQVTDAAGQADAQAGLQDVASWLAQHGIIAAVQTRLADSNETVALALVADELAADIVVAGAYGHSRVREWALGGVTRTLLRHATRLSFVSH